MRKSLAALGLVFSLGLAGLFLAHKPWATLPPTVNFVGFLPPDDWGKLETRKAAFTVTNWSPRCIAVGRFQVETFTNGVWQMHSNYVAGALIKSIESPNLPLLLDSGASETLVVDCPEGRRCRIRALYSSQNSGIRSVFARIRVAYRVRDWGVLRSTNFQYFVGPASFESDAIPEGVIERETTPSQEPSRAPGGQ